MFLPDWHKVYANQTEASLDLSFNFEVIPGWYFRGEDSLFIEPFDHKRVIVYVWNGQPHMHTIFSKIGSAPTC